MEKMEKSIIVCQANIDEFNTILDIDESIYGFRTRGKFIAESILRNECYKAIAEDKIVGFIILNYTFYENGFIGLLVVDNSYRRLKVGTHLLEHVEKVCTTEKVFTSTNKSNLAMQGLLSSCGYVSCGYIEGLDEGDPELVYYKRLK
ncbi:MAG TPA: GNAT family N-acetyltransferase [Clostridia bacterium]|nr:GNAT family N-acetyltransferase [Clostridia bacterium]